MCELLLYFSNNFIVFLTSSSAQFYPDKALIWRFLSVSSSCHCYCFFKREFPVHCSSRLMHLRRLYKYEFFDCLPFWIYRITPLFINLQSILLNFILRKWSKMYLPIFITQKHASKQKHLMFPTRVNQWTVTLQLYNSL